MDNKEGHAQPSQPAIAGRTGTLRDQALHLRAIRGWLLVVIVGLAVSGVTAFPLETELRMMHASFSSSALRHFSEFTRLLPWITQVHQALAATNRAYPFLAYGTDWLAFAHILFAVLFLGPYRDPVRNRWVITFGLIASAAIFPLAFIAGPLRHIPLGWRFIDSSFAIFAAVPLMMCLRHLRAIDEAGA